MTSRAIFTRKIWIARRGGLWTAGELLQLAAETTDELTITATVPCEHDTAYAQSQNIKNFFVLSNRDTVCVRAGPA